MAGQLSRKIVQTVPVDSIHLALQQLGRALKSPLLHLFRPKGRYADFGDPDRQLRDGANLRNLVGPFVDRPMIPVEGKAVHGDDVEVVQDILLFQRLYKVGIDRRDTAQHAPGAADSPA